LFVTSFAADLPLLGVLAWTLLAVLAALELGYRWASRRTARHKLENESTVGGVVAATLGLLAFLLAVTFGIAADAFHARKVALTEETSAIEMSYHLTDLASEADGAQVRALLRQYVDERLRFGNNQPDPRGGSADELLDQLWKAAATVAKTNPGAFDVFLGYIGRVVELQQERLMVRERSRIPRDYWVVLYIVALLALATVGYHVGVAGKGRTPVMLAVAIAFSATIMVIADLDRPGKGFINVSQEPMAELRARLVGSNGGGLVSPIERGRGVPSRLPRLPPGR
jgi:hypothetical protein